PLCHRSHPHTPLFPYTTLFRSPKGNSDRQAFLCEIIDAGKTLDPATGGKCVHDEIHRPGQIGRRRTEQRQTFCCQPFTTSSAFRSEEHTSELQSRFDLVCRLLL